MVILAYFDPCIRYHVQVIAGGCDWQQKEMVNINNNSNIKNFYQILPPKLSPVEQR